MSEYDWRYEFELWACGGCTVGEMKINLLQKAVPDQKEKHTIAELRKLMPPCPICGKKAFLFHDIVDGFDFGWSAGCPSYCLDDEVHGISEPYDPDAPKVDSHDPEIAFRKWSDYCERMKRNGRSNDP